MKGMKYSMQTRKPSQLEPWRKFYDRDFNVDEIPKVSIYQMAMKNKDSAAMAKIAIDMRIERNDFNRGVKISYQDLFGRIEKSAEASTALGIKPNQIIPIILPNVPEARILIYSNSIIGATSYPISPLLPASELEKIIYDNDIKSLFILEQFYPKYERALRSNNLESVVLLDGTESFPNYVQLLQRMKKAFKSPTSNFNFHNSKLIPWQEYCALRNQINEKIEPYYEENHIAVVIGTSGTTGTSKGVKLTDINLNTAAASYLNGKLLEGTILDALLPSIGYGMSMIHYQMVSGTYVYLIPSLLTTRFPEALFKLNPDNFAGGPVHYINLARSQEFRDGKVHRGKNNISGGASLPREVEKKLNGIEEGYTEEEKNDRLIVRQGFGLTENIAMGTYAKPGSYKFGSIGIPVPYLTMGIFKPGTDEELDYYEEGEICITGPSVMAGYLNNDAETEKVIKIHGDGKRWIHTKDIGYMDEDGRLFHCERIKNIFMRNGFNVHPTKIAEFLNTIEFVKNSYVIGVSHPEEQFVPIAFVEVDERNLEGGKIEEMIRRLLEICYENLEETSIPHDFIFTANLPINIGGKVDALKLSEEASLDPTTRKVKKRVINFCN